MGKRIARVFKSNPPVVFMTHVMLHTSTVGRSSCCIARVRWLGGGGGGQTSGHSTPLLHNRVTFCIIFCLYVVYTRNLKLVK